MNLTIGFWEFAGLLITLLGAWWGGAKLFFAQVDRRFDERFAAMERRHQEQMGAIQALFGAHAAEEKSRLERIDADVKAHGERMARLEQDIERMPNHDDLGRLYDKLNVVAGGVASLAGKLDGIEVNMRLVVGQFIEKGMTK